MNPQDNTPPEYSAQNQPSLQNQPNSPTQYNPKERVSNELAVMQPGETIVCNIKRHPIGIIGIYVMLGFVLTLAAALIFGLGSSISDSSQVTQIGSVVFLFLAVICLGYAMIATTVYWGNKWVVTSDSVTQIQRSSLFGRQSAQLALSNIEDVTAEQNGILAHMFNYGVLKAETAGHRSKFVFSFAPNPNFYAQKILEAREALGGSHHGISANNNGGNQSPVPNQNTLY